MMHIIIPSSQNTNIAHIPKIRKEIKMMNHRKPKPDDRSDNVEKLQQMVHDTIENIEESHDTLRYASGQARDQIKEKNERRRESIEGMREEIKDEYDHQQSQ